MESDRFLVRYILKDYAKHADYQIYTVGLLYDVIRNPANSDEYVYQFLRDKVALVCKRDAAGLLSALDEREKQHE